MGVSGTIESTNQEVVLDTSFRSVDNIYLKTRIRYKVITFPFPLIIIGNDVLTKAKLRPHFNFPPDSSFAIFEHFPDSVIICSVSNTIPLNPNWNLSITKTNIGLRLKEGGQSLPIENIPFDIKSLEKLLQKTTTMEINTKFLNVSTNEVVSIEEKIVIATETPTLLTNLNENIPIITDYNTQFHNPKTRNPSLCDTNIHYSEFKSLEELQKPPPPLQIMNDPDEFLSMDDLQKLMEEFNIPQEEIEIPEAMEEIWKEGKIQMDLSRHKRGIWVTKQFLRKYHKVFSYAGNLIGSY